MAAGGSGGVFKFLNPKLRPQPNDIQSVALWGVAAGTSALWLVQPFGWLKKTFFEKPEPEGK
ncbi:Ubiquinol-cytochrome c reductase complex 6.7 kDa protein [Morella rubra]|uniref:Ubiquinol-cytochrome c reductase complex 6.7 kDa protein n=1 Tax=Morella rubra TaxID=262757 RepID=A0A6A1WKI6_9ROSI|nr:Ubiquinol-cytochrome c reductase complex 6.7 kDa protein [Morella rubra]